MPRRRSELLLTAALIGLTACGAASPGTPSGLASTETLASPSPTERPWIATIPETTMRPGLPTITEIVSTDPRMARAAVLLNSQPLVILRAIAAHTDRFFTVFAPSNQAIDALPDAVVRRLAGEGEYADVFTRQLVSMHWAGGADWDLSSVASGTSLAMSQSRVRYTTKDGVGYVDYAAILDVVPAANGYVYLIDTVLLPPCESDVGQEPAPTHAPCDTWLEPPA
jgi:hypothetical protein